jgi:hypothetical protein
LQTREEKLMTEKKKADAATDETTNEPVEEPKVVLDPEFEAEMNKALEAEAAEHEAILVEAEELEADYQAARAEREEIHALEEEIVQMDQAIETEEAEREAMLNDEVEEVEEDDVVAEATVPPVTTPRPTPAPAPVNHNHDEPENTGRKWPTILAIGAVIVMVAGVLVLACFMGADRATRELDGNSPNNVAGVPNSTDLIPQPETPPAVTTDPVQETDPPVVTEPEPETPATEGVRTTHIDADRCTVERHALTVDGRPIVREVYTCPSSAVTHTTENQ